MFNNKFQAAQQWSQKNIWNSSDWHGPMAQEFHEKISRLSWWTTSLLRVGTLLFDQKHNNYMQSIENIQKIIDDCHHQFYLFSNSTLKNFPRIGRELSYWKCERKNVAYCFSLFWDLYREHFINTYLFLQMYTSQESCCKNPNSWSKFPLLAV